MRLKTCAILAVMLLTATVHAQRPSVNDQNDLNATIKRAEELLKKGDRKAALPIYELALTTATRLYGANDERITDLLFMIADVHWGLHQIDKAEPFLQRLIQIREMKRGPLDSSLVKALNLLAQGYLVQLRFADTDKIYQRIVSIHEKTYGKDHPVVGFAYTNRADLYLRLVQPARAEPLYERGLAIFSKAFGPNHPMLCVPMDGLTNCYRLQGQYDRAEQTCRKALAFAEEGKGKDSPDAARCLHSLAVLYQESRDYDQAVPLLERCLRIREEKLGPNSRLVAEVLCTLGDLCREQRQYARAEQLLERSLKVAETGPHPSDFAIAHVLRSLAQLYQDQGDLARAEPLLLRSQRLIQDKITARYPLFATMQSQLATLYWQQGKSAAAETHLRSALQSRADYLGAKHPDTLDLALRLAEFLAAQGRWNEATTQADDCRRTLHQHVGRALLGLAEQQQLNYLRWNFEPGLHRCLSFSLAGKGDERLAALTASWLLNGKGVAHRALAQRSLLVRDLGSSAIADLARRLLDVRQRLANLTNEMPLPGEEDDHRRKLAVLAAEEERLSRQLGQQAGSQLNAADWVELSAVRRAIPADGVLIDIARFRAHTFQAKGTNDYPPERYAAWIIPPANQGEVQVIDLGPAAAIDDAVRRFRDTIGRSGKTIYEEGEHDAELLAVKELRAVAERVLTPLLPHIGTRAHWLISPDASLWLVPWAALPLPEGRYVVERHRLGYLTSGRDLVDRPVRVAPGPAVVLADPNFDLDPRSTGSATGEVKSGTARSRSLSSKVAADWPRLSGSAAEAQLIRPFLNRYLRAEPRVYTGDRATESACKSCKRPRVLVLSTHGYFLQDEDRTPAGGTGASTARSATSNPFLRCGLVLAGANRRSKVRSEESEDGLLTGLEILELDLRGTELVLLSACDTGIGAVQNGEGVAGLRQAFQLAGAEGVVASLWKVPDAETAQLMGRFWQALADRPDRAEALREAQLAMIQTRRSGKAQSAHPYFWAAFTLTGQWRPEGYNAPPRPILPPEPIAETKAPKETIPAKVEPARGSAEKAVAVVENETAPPEKVTATPVRQAVVVPAATDSWLPYGVGGAITALVLVCGLIAQRGRRGR